jgi:hypothetical protein
MPLRFAAMPPWVCGKHGKNHGKPMDTSHLTDQTGGVLASPHELDQIHVGLLPQSAPKGWFAQYVSEQFWNTPFSGQSKSSSRRVKLWKPLFFKR